MPRRSFYRWVFLLVMLGSFVGGCGFEKLAEPKVKLVVYSEMPEAVTTELVEAFQKKEQKKIEVEVKYLAFTDINKKLEFLQKAEGDIWLGAVTEDYYLAEARKMLSPYKLGTLNQTKLYVSEKTGDWLPLLTTNLGFLCNLQVLQDLEAEVPSSWTELAEENLTATVVMSRPEIGAGGYRLRTTLWELYGEKQALVFAHRLGQREVAYVESDEAALKAVQKGDKAVAVVPLDMAMAVVGSKNHLAVSLPADGSSRINVGVAILQQTAHSEASKKLLDYLGSEQAADIFDDTGSYCWPVTLSPTEYIWGKNFKDTFLVKKDLRWSVLYQKEINQKWQEAAIN